MITVTITIQETPKQRLAITANAVGIDASTPRERFAADKLFECYEEFSDVMLAAQKENNAEN